MLSEIIKLREAIQQGGPQSTKVLADLMSSGPPPPIPPRNQPQVSKFFYEDIMYWNTFFARQYIIDLMRHNGIMIIHV